MVNVQFIWGFWLVNLVWASRIEPLTLGKIGFQMEQEKRVMEEDAKKIKEFKSYNILPLETPGVPNPFVFFPEVRKWRLCFMCSGKYETNKLSSHSRSSWMFLFVVF